MVHTPVGFQRKTYFCAFGCYLFLWCSWEFLYFVLGGLLRWNTTDWVFEHSVSQLWRTGSPRSRCQQIHCEAGRPTSLCLKPAFLGLSRERHGDPSSLFFSGHFSYLMTVLLLRSHLILIPSVKVLSSNLALRGVGLQHKFLGDSSLNSPSHGPLWTHLCKYILSGI